MVVGQPSRNRAVEPTSSASMPFGRVVVERDRDAAARARASCSSPRRRRGRCRGRARSRAAIASRSSSEATRSTSRCIHDSVTTPNSSVGRCLVVVDLLQGPDGVAADDELRVDDEVDGTAERCERGGDRVDEERHVVGDDLDDGVPAGPALRLDGRVRHVDVGRADRTPPRQVALGECGAEEVLGLAGEQVLGRGVPVEDVQQPVDLGPGLLGGVLGSGAQLLGPGLVERRRHGLVRVPSLMGRGHASSGAVSRVSPLFTCWTHGPECPRGAHAERGGERRGGMRRSAYRGDGDDAEWAATVTASGSAPRRAGPCPGRRAGAGARAGRRHARPRSRHR